MPNMRSGDGQGDPVGEIMQHHAEITDSEVSPKIQTCSPSVGLKLILFMINSSANLSLINHLVYKTSSQREGDAFKRLVVSNQQLKRFILF